MRYKNLTITITLGVLSMVAVAGLVLMPISDGICEWTGDAANKSYSNSSVDIEQEQKPNDFNNWSKDTQMGRGWSISASLNATEYGASASVSPSIYGLITFTDATTYGGTANVSASRCDVTRESEVLPGASNSNEGQERTLGAKVIEQGIEHWHMVGHEITKKGGHKVRGGVEGKVNVVAVVDVTVSADYEWATEEGKTFREDNRTKITITELVKGDSQGQSASVGAAYVFGPGAAGGDGPVFIAVSARTSASLDFHFSGHSSSNSVSYDPDDAD